MGKLKTCVEVFHVLKNYENNPLFEEGKANSEDDGNKVESNENMVSIYGVSSENTCSKSQNIMYL